jgi:WD40 repeat protein
MKKRSAFQLLIILTLLLTACSGNASTPISNEDAVATAVATMISGLSTDMPPIEQTAVATIAIENPIDTLVSEPVATSTPGPQTLLPRSFYYLTQDTNGMGQIYRLGQDGNTITQITYEQGDVNGFDISPIDGTISYVSQNNLININSNGEDRQVLLQEPTIYFPPVWSPDGKMIVYNSGKDVKIYSLDSRQSTTLIAGKENERNWPEAFSLDGQKLIVRNKVIPSAPEGQLALIYDLASQISIPIAGGEIKNYPCFGNITWIANDVFFCHSHLSGTVIDSGLWRINANDGAVETLMGGTRFQPPFSLVTAPRQDAAGTLYYLYGEDDGNYFQGKPNTVFSLVRSDADGQTNRTLLRPEIFPVNFANWTPDGKALIVFGQKEFGAPFTLSVVPVDSSLPIVELLSNIPVNSFFTNTRWGQ